MRPLSDAEARAVIEKCLPPAQAADVLRIAGTGLFTPAQFVSTALRTYAVEKAARLTAGAYNVIDENAEHDPAELRPARSSKTALKQPSAFPAPTENEPCFLVQARARDLIHPLLTALFICVGRPPTDAEQRSLRSGGKGRIAGPGVVLVITQTRDLKFWKIVAAICRGHDPAAERALRIRVSKGATTMNFVEHRTAQNLALLKEQGASAGQIPAGCRGLIHPDSATIFGRGAVGLTQGADERILAILREHGIASGLAKLAHTADSTARAAELIKRAFAARAR